MENMSANMARALLSPGILSSLAKVEKTPHANESVCVEPDFDWVAECLRARFAGNVIRVASEKFCIVLVRDLIRDAYKIR